MEATKNGVRSSKARPLSAGIMTRVQSSLITAPDIIDLILISPAIIRIDGDRVIGPAGAMDTDMDMGIEAGATADGGEIIPVSVDLAPAKYPRGDRHEEH
jgi:hypothetical protein